MSKRIATYISDYHYTKLEELKKDRVTSISRLLAIAIDNELEEEDPFLFDYTLPEFDVNNDMAYIDEAGKILNFLNLTGKSYGLDVLLMLRFDIGIPSKILFLGGFNEALIKGFITVDKGHRPPSQDFGSEYDYYKSAPLDPINEKAKRKKIKELKQLEKLQKKYAPGGVNDV